NYSLKNYDETINDYKRILSSYPNSGNADAALVGLQEALALQGRSGEFSNYLVDYKKSNPDNSSLQNIEFEAAKNLFFNQSFKEAITSFENYKKSYPGSGQVHEANYFIGEAYLRRGDKNRALQYFYELEKSNGSPPQYNAIETIAEIEYSNENYAKAVPYCMRSAASARHKIEEYEAKSRLMNAYFYLSEYDSAAFYTD